MIRRTSKSEMKAWMRRWKLVNQVETEEWRAATPEQRLRELETLFAFAHSVGHREDKKGVAAVRRRWLRLKERARDR